MLLRLWDLEEHRVIERRGLRDPSRVTDRAPCHFQVLACRPRGGTMRSVEVSRPRWQAAVEFLRVSSSRRSYSWSFLLGNTDGNNVTYSVIEGTLTRSSWTRTFDGHTWNVIVCDLRRPLEMFGIFRQKVPFVLQR